MTAKILTKQIKKQEKQIKSLQKLLKDQTKGSKHLTGILTIGSSTFQQQGQNTNNINESSSSLKRGGVLMMNDRSDDSQNQSIITITNKNKRNLTHTRKKMSSKLLNRYDKQKEIFDNLSPIMTPTTGGRGGRRDRGSGAYLRSQKLQTGLPISEEQNKLIDTMINELEIFKDKLTPTQKVCNQYDNLRKQILIFLQLSKQIDSKKEQIKQIKNKHQQIKQFNIQQQISLQKALANAPPPHFQPPHLQQQHYHQQFNRMPPPPPQMRPPGMIPPPPHQQNINPNNNNNGHHHQHHHHPPPPQLGSRSQSMTSIPHMQPPPHSQIPRNSIPQNPQQQQLQQQHVGGVQNKMMNRQQSMESGKDVRTPPPPPLTTPPPPPGGSYGQAISIPRKNSSITIPSQNSGGVGGIGGGRGQVSRQVSKGGSPKSVASGRMTEIPGRGNQGKSDRDKGKKKSS